MLCQGRMWDGTFVKWAMGIWTVFHWELLQKGFFWHLGRCPKKAEEPQTRKSGKRSCSEGDLIQSIVIQWCHMATEIWINIASGNNLLPQGTRH